MGSPVCNGVFAFGVLHLGVFHLEFCFWGFAFGGFAVAVLVLICSRVSRLQRGFAFEVLHSGFCILQQGLVFAFGVFAFAFLSRFAVGFHVCFWGFCIQGFAFEVLHLGFLQLGVLHLLFWSRFAAGSHICSGVLHLGFLHLRFCFWGFCIWGFCT